MARGGRADLTVNLTERQLLDWVVRPTPLEVLRLDNVATGVRMGLHVNDPLGGPGATARVAFEDYVRTVRPAGIKLLAAAYDPSIVDFCHAHGVKVICRRVIHMPSLGPDGRDALNEMRAWGRERGWHMDYLEFANEEFQGKDDPKDWDRLCEYMLEQMKALDAETGGRVKAVILNCSVGQPELERWTRPKALAMLDYAGRHGHLVGIHEYYKPRPWHGVEGQWTNWGRVEGWWMLRILKVVRILRQMGIVVPQFAITESGRDDVPGTPGIGSGFRDEPVTPDGDYADFMLQIGRHYSGGELRGVIAIWVDFGFNARTPTASELRGGAKDWRPFSLFHDLIMLGRVKQTQLLIPMGGVIVGDVDLAALYAEGQRHQCAKITPSNGLIVAAVSRGKAKGGNNGPWPTSDEWTSQARGVLGHAAMRFQDPVTGQALIATWHAGKTTWHDVTHLDQPGK